MIHLLLHFLLPIVVALIFSRKKWFRASIIMISTMLVDLDHLLAQPIYEATRCSIGFHPLHTVIPICIYFIICFIPKLRWVGIGLMIHMVLDSLDCQFNQGLWYV